MYPFRYSAILLSWLLSVGFLPAAELRIVPPEVSLARPNATQRILVLVHRDGDAVAEVTAESKLSSANPKVVEVDARGTVRAVGDGETTITAQWQGKTASVRVKVQGASKPLEWSFRNDVIPILTKLGCNSGGCHGALAGKGGLKLSLRGFDPERDHFVLTRQAAGRRIDLVDPANSLLLRKPTTVVKHGGGKKLDVESPEFRLLIEWIAMGAPGPRSDDPRVVGIDVFPSRMRLGRKQQMPLLVRARYSDGTVRDVTRWSKFQSTEDLVAAVDAEGNIRVSGYGEAAVTAWYSNFVAVARIASPLPNRVDAKVFATARRNNFIDDLVLKKLQSLNIPPSPLADDYTFIRRAYLDAIGVLPTPDEVEQFVSDPSPDKRRRMVDRLLERSEYVDYWSYYWSDVFLVSTRKLSEPAMWAFYQHIRKSIADNKPWDRFAREILTADGSNLTNGAANYFVMHTDISDLTETTTVTFMGTSLTCARCHNHPMEKWTQDQYWSFANLFARVKLRNGDRPGEILVIEEPTGDVPHLRRGVAMPPAPLDAKPLPLTSTASRRAYFADWLTSKDNPYFARALVNRIWKNFMGRGLVEAEDDLRETNPPSNPELLDALARDFIDHKYDVKHLIRTIMNSATYQRSSRTVPGNEKDDRFYSHYLVRRLKAEVVLDAYSHVTGVPTVFNRVAVGASGGIRNTNAYPKGTRALQLPDTLVVSQFLDSFGRPQREQPCSCERQQDSSVTQALQLSNGKTLNEKLRSKDCRITQWLAEKISPNEAIDRVFLLALSRRPSPQEKQRLVSLMNAAGNTPQARREALEDLFWAVLTGREFLFNH